MGFSLGELSVFALIAVPVLWLLSEALSAREKDRVVARRIEAKLDQLIELGGAVPVPGNLKPTYAHLERGERVQAIKAYRAATGAGLIEAKESVDQLAADTPGSPPKA